MSYLDLLRKTDARWERWQQLRFIAHIEAFAGEALQLTSKIRSRIDYLIPTGNIILLILYFNLTKKCKKTSACFSTIWWQFYIPGGGYFFGPPCIPTESSRIVLHFGNSWRLSGHSVAWRHRCVISKHAQWTGETDCDKRISWHYAALSTVNQRQCLHEKQRTTPNIWNQKCATDNVAGVMKISSKSVICHRIQKTSDLRPETHLIIIIINYNNKSSISVSPLAIHFRVLMLNVCSVFCQQAV